MPRVDHSKFIINSDFPMPAQVSNVIGEVFVPSGTVNTTTKKFTTDIAVGPEAKMFRVGIKSSRDGKVYVANAGLYQYLADGSFGAWIRNKGNGTVRCEVVLNPGNDYQITSTTSDNNFTFYISSFKLP